MGKMPEAQNFLIPPRRLPCLLNTDTFGDYQAVAAIKATKPPLEHKKRGGSVQDFDEDFWKR